MAFEVGYEGDAGKAAAIAPVFDPLALLKGWHLLQIAQNQDKSPMSVEGDSSHPGNDSAGDTRTASEGGELFIHLINFDQCPQGKTTEKSTLAGLLGNAAADKVANITRKGDHFSIMFNQPLARIEQKQVDKNTGQLAVTSFVTFDQTLSFNYSKTANGAVLSGMKGIKAEKTSGVEGIGHVDVDNVILARDQLGDITVTAHGAAHLGILNIGVSGTKTFEFGPKGERLR